MGAPVEEMQEAVPVVARRIDTASAARFCK